MKVLGRSRRGSAFGAVSIGILIFTLATLLTLSACGSDEPEVVDTATPEPVVPTATSAPEPTEEPTSEPCGANCGADRGADTGAGCAD